MLLILGLLNPGMALGLGLGELTLQSFLNEPLRARVDLLETEGLDEGQLRIRLATREDFARAGVERAYFLTGLKFEVELDDAGGTVLVTSRDPVREPYLDFIIEARWPNGRLLREYTLLLDPPVFVEAPGAFSARVPGQPVEPAVPVAQQDSGVMAPAFPDAASRTYGADALDTPTAGASYLVARNDTLWRIASRARPANATVPQTMLDIQRLNPEAFIGNNINQLKAGYVLRLPGSNQISDIAAEEALAAVNQQAEDWQQGVPTTSLPRVDASEGDGSSGVAGSDQGEGRLQIAGIEDNLGDTASAGDLSARLEDLDRAQRDNADLQTRVAAMEEQLDMQRRLIALKDDQIAAMQQALGDAGADQTDAGTGGREGAIESLPDTTVTAATTEPPPAEQTATPPPEEPERPASPPPAPEPGIVDLLMANLLYIIIALVVLVLAAAGWHFRDRVSDLVNRRRGQKLGADEDEFDDEFAGVELVGDDSLIVDEFTEQDDSGEMEVAESSSFSAPDEEAYAAQFETGDALAEADIYIAYGRFPQAVDLLKSAIAIEPINVDYRMKLMEACVEMVDSSEFQQQYADLQVIGDEPALERARSLLDAVDGGEVWLDDLPEPMITQDDVATAREAAEDPQSGEGTVLAFGATDLSSERELAEEKQESDPSAPIDFEAAELPDQGIDEALSDTDASAAGEADEALDLDLDLELESEPLAAEAGDDLGLDLELESGEEEADLGLDFSVDEETAEPAAEDLEIALDEPAEAESLAELSVEEDEPAASEEDEDTLAVDEIEGLEIEGLDDESADDEALVLEDDGMDLSEFDMGDLGAEVEDSGEEPEAGADLGLPDLELESVETGDEGGEPAAEEGVEGEDLLADLGELEIESSDSTVDDGGLDLEAEGGLDLEDAGGLDLEESTGLDLEGSAEPELSEAADDTAGEADAENMEFSIDESEESAEDSEEGGLMFATDGDEIATKLDLARAYIDMGDQEGARAILDEVLQDGSESQQQEAQSLLDSID